MPETREKSLEDIDASFRGYKCLYSRGEVVMELKVEQVRFTPSMKD